MPQHGDDFPDLNPLLIPQICNKFQNMLKIHCIDTLNKETNHICTIVSQIKGLLTKTIFSVCLPNFHPCLYHLYTTYILVLNVSQLFHCINKLIFSHKQPKARKRVVPGGAPQLVLPFSLLWVVCEKKY